MKHDNSWREKSAALDHYRWMQLRERYALGGTLLRFLRDALVDTWLGLLAKTRLRNSIERQTCDILLLQSAPFVIGLKRKKLLIEALIGQGYRLTETSLDEPQIICKKRFLARPPQSVPLRYFYYAAHATWLVEHYRPKILLNDRNGSLYSPFLRLRLNEENSVLVHLAHATTLEGSRRLGMNDYDYYLLFGRSSLEALQSRPLRFGNSTALLTGSHMIDQSFDLPKPEQIKKTVLILGVGPDKEKKPGYQNTYALLRNWARAHREYRMIVKSHPRSTVPFWQEAAETSDNISVLPPRTHLSEALSQASIVVNIMSNAVIEAALAGLPIIYCNLSEERDIFSQDIHFGVSAVNIEDFQARIASIEQNYDEHCQRSRVFSDFHLANGFHGLNVTVQTLASIIKHTAPGPSVESQAINATF